MTQCYKLTEQPIILQVKYPHTTSTIDHFTTKSVLQADITNARSADI
jgi:hypothetical protein